MSTLNVAIVAACVLTFCTGLARLILALHGGAHDSGFDAAFASAVTVTLSLLAAGHISNGIP